MVDLRRPPRSPGDVGSHREADHRASALAFPSGTIDPGYARAANGQEANRIRFAGASRSVRTSPAARGATTGVQPDIWPPSTTSVWPVIQLARSLARNSTACATSSGRPIRPDGMPRNTRS